LTSFRPGERLANSMVVFVFANAASAARGAVSHVESLAESACKRKSRDAMSCLSCHNPHVQPEPAARADYYRARCLQCHATLAERHHPDQRDCVACHMPRVDSADVGHTAVTDHRILREPGAAPTRPLGDKLTPFGGTSTDARDLGLSYAEIALRGNAWAAREARRLLEGALARYGSDPEVLTRLAYIEQAESQLGRAQALYQQSLSVDPSQPVAATNLGVILAERGLTARAIAVWRPAFDHHPEASELGVDLSMGLCKTGDWKGAVDELRTVLAHNPDFDSARQMAAALARGPDACRGD
jgi:predicted CXXCH cytochrome family protein